MTAVHAMLNVTKCNFSYSEDCLAKTQKKPNKWCHNCSVLFLKSIT